MKLVHATNGLVRRIVSERNFCTCFIFEYITLISTIAITPTPKKIINSERNIIFFLGLIAFVIFSSFLLVFFASALDFCAKTLVFFF